LVYKIIANRAQCGPKRATWTIILFEKPIAF
jgi:hypothetical protein